MPQSVSRPNIVLVSIDSLRADHCGFLGDDRDLTPTMDRLASDGITFQNAIAPGPQTFSSMPAVFTGTHRPPGDIDDHSDRSYWERRMAAIATHLRRHRPFTEELQRLGYTTAAFTPNPWTSTNTGFDRGFDHFDDRSGADEQSWLSRVGDRIPGLNSDSRPFEIAESLLSGGSFFARWDEFYDDLSETVESLPEPYFLWVFLLDTHFPFVVGKAHREEQSLVRTYVNALRARGAMEGRDDDLSPRALAALKRSYRDSVRASDDFVSQLHSDLAADDPVLFVHSDHGESFGDHGHFGHHHRRLYEENVHVPYFVHNVGRTDEIEAPTSLATIHDAILETGRRGTFDPDATTSEQVYTFSEYDSKLGVRGSRYKYVVHDGESHLFDLERDPGEHHDRSAERPGLCDQLRRSLADVERHTDEIDRLGRAAHSVAATAEF